MDRANYLLKNFSVCSAARRKVQNPPAKKILRGSSKIPSLKSTLNFYKDNDISFHKLIFFFIDFFII